MLVNPDDILGKRHNTSDDDFFKHKRKAWKDLKKTEARCDFAKDRWRMNSRGILFISLWKASVYGMTLSSIKADDDMPDFFSKNISDFIKRIFNVSENSENSAFSDYILVTPPPRRHTTNNFCETVAHKISELLGIHYAGRIAAVKNRQRVNAEFTIFPDAGKLLKNYSQIICFDDIVTTGSTFIAMNKILAPLGKPVIYITAINNKL